MRFVRALLSTTAALTIALIAARQSLAVNYDSVAAGLWSTGATWSPIGVPGSGDAVNLDLGVTVSGNQFFGDGANNSIFDNTANPSITLNAGQTLTHVAGSTFISTAGGGYTSFSGTGTFANAGTFNVNNRFILAYPAAGTTMNNTGLVEFGGTAGRMEYLFSGATFDNQTGGTVRVNMTAATDTASIYTSSAVDTGAYLSNGGNPIDFVQGRLEFAPQGGIGGTLTDAKFAELFGPINASSALRLGGVYDISLTGATDLTRVTLGGGNAYRAAALGSTISATGASGLRFTNAGFIDTVVGRTITNAAGSLLINSPGEEVYFSGTGSINNLGTIRIGNRFLVGYTVGGTTINNSGLVEMTNNAARIELYQTGSTYNNLVGSEIDVTLANGTDLAYAYNLTSAAVTFENQGTVEVNRGIFRVQSSVGAPVTTTSWTSTNLATGTWRVLAGAQASTLDLQSNSTSVGGGAQWDGSITAIDSGASLVMSRTGAGIADFLQLGALANVNGSLMVHGTLSLPVSNALAVTGTLGGDGTINTTGAITFTGGTLDPTSLSGGAGSLDISGDLVLDATTALEFGLGASSDLVNVTGDLTLDGVLNITQLAGFGEGVYTLFDYGTLTDNGLTVTPPIDRYFTLIDTGSQILLDVSGVVPEPSTWTMLAFGLAALGYRTRRRAK